MTISRDLFLDVLRHPERLVELDLRQWDHFLPMVNQIEMLPNLVAPLDAANLSQKLPDRLEMHLESARLRTAQQRRMVSWEVSAFEALLAGTEIPMVLLKGAAYLILELDIAAGRMYSDIDVMVPKASVQKVKKILLDAGWQQPEELASQEQYYLRWMHELLPMIHPRRGTKLDVHHNILPSTDNLQFDAALLFQDAEPISAGARIYTLSPVDMVLHNIVNLFRNGDYRRALRDLLDLHRITQRFRIEDEFFLDRLVQRAEALNLRTQCFLAFRYVGKYLDVDYPESFISKLEHGRPLWPGVAVMDQLFEYASLPTALVPRESARRISLSLLERYPLSLLRRSVVPKLERHGIFLLNPRY